MYPPTLCHTKLLQASSLESPQPFLLHPVHLATLLSADLRDSTKLSILSGATFTTPTSPSPSSLFFPLFADRYIACRPVRRYHTVHPRSTHIPHPSPHVPTARDNNGTDLVVFYRTEGEKGDSIYCCHFFERFQAHRSSTTTRPVLVTRRCDAPTRSLSPPFLSGMNSMTPRITFIDISR